MRIGFLVNYFYPSTGGEEELTFTIAKELVSRGHEVHVFTSDRKDGVIFPKEEVISGIKIHRSNVWFRYRVYLTFDPSISFKHLRYDLDVLHVMSVGFFFHDVAVILRRLFTKTKIVNTPHGPFMALMNYSLLQKFFRFCFRLFEYPINHLYHAVCQDNYSQKSWMIKSGFVSDRIHYLPVPVPNSLLERVSSRTIKRFNLSSKFVISYLGRVQKYKGLDQIVRVLPSLRKINDKVCFVMMGVVSENEDVRLKSLAKDLGVDDLLLFTGRVSDEEKLAVLDASEIFVFPSEWEAFGIVMVEAMARSCAIVSTNTEGGKFLIKNEVNGFLFDFGDVKTLEKHLVTLVKNDFMRNNMKDVNVRKADNFLVSKVVLEYEGLYSRLITSE